ncbi:hypothetical protein, partial [Haliscomenobacter sp.]|uniref:hypothetical protein n=1 Tax=Haliscomenobacter sp. TaxID=2717303 RepID=UPI003364D91C
MNFKLRSTILGWLCIFIATWVSAAPPLPSLNASKFKYGLLEKIPTSVARFFPAALPKPLKTQASIAANTVQWTGALSTDWNTAGNWTSVSGTPSLPPKKGSITGDHVIIPNVSGGSGNFPVITIDSARARSITLQAGASLTINSGGKLEVVGSDTDGFTNEGVFTNKGTILVDSAYNDAFVNKLNAQIINQGQLTLQKGFGNRLLNYGSITNTSGNFNVLDGVDTAFINYPTGSVINNATFSVNGGNNLRLYNRGAISNKSSFTVGGATAGHSFVNAVGASLTNEGTFQINGGFASQMINYSNIDNLS